MRRHVKKRTGTVWNSSAKIDAHARLSRMSNDSHSFQRLMSHSLEVIILSLKSLMYKNCQCSKLCTFPTNAGALPNLNSLNGAASPPSERKMLSLCGLCNDRASDFLVYT